MQTITLPPPKRSWFSLFSWAILLAVLVISWKGAEMDPLLLFKDAGNMATFAADFFPPDFSQWQDYLAKWLSPCKSPSGGPPWPSSSPFRLA